MTKFFLYLDFHLFDTIWNAHSLLFYRNYVMFAVYLILEMLSCVILSCKKMQYTLYRYTVYGTHESQNKRRDPETTFKNMNQFNWANFVWFLKSHELVFEKTNFSEKSTRTYYLEITKVKFIKRKMSGKLAKLSSFPIFSWETKTKHYIFTIIIFFHHVLFLISMSLFPYQKLNVIKFIHECEVLSHQLQVESVPLAF